jgi:hypothetical protein
LPACAALCGLLTSFFSVTIPLTSSDECSLYVLLCHSVRCSLPFLRLSLRYDVLQLAPLSLRYSLRLLLWREHQWLLFDGRSYELRGYLVKTHE